MDYSGRDIYRAKIVDLARTHYKNEAKLMILKTKEAEWKKKKAGQVLLRNRGIFNMTTSQG